MRPSDQRALDDLCATATAIISSNLRPVGRWDAKSARWALDHALDFLTHMLRERADTDGFDFLLDDTQRRRDREKGLLVAADHLQWRITRIGDLRGALEASL
ncbi:hypothetical protein [Geminicoccus harenae]|uniref:hypothetical protein n=1 Tax=Geminicoccus harenae TaxID=2498453 RepID=UPI00168B491E|nr:hypothetical protein [Geminicoccus harenae]